MKVILLKDVGGVGQRGSVKEVADGYALNYLIARGLAEQATSAKMAAHAAEEKKLNETREKENEALKTLVHSLNNARLEVKARATEKGGLFKSISAGDVAKIILEQKRARIPESAIQLAKPIKEIGEHKINVRAQGADSEILLDVKAA